MATNRKDSYLPTRTVVGCCSRATGRAGLVGKKIYVGIPLFFCAVTSGHTGSFLVTELPISWGWSFSSLSNFFSDHEKSITCRAPLRTTHLITSSTYNLLLRYFMRDLQTLWSVYIQNTALGEINYYCQNDWLYCFHLPVTTILGKASQTQNMLMMLVCSLMTSSTASQMIQTFVLGTSPYKASVDSVSIGCRSITTFISTMFFDADFVQMR